MAIRAISQVAVGVRDMDRALRFYRDGLGLRVKLDTGPEYRRLRGIMRDWERKFSSKNLETRLEAADDLPPLQVDEGRLQEVIYNLLDNAVKYSPVGGGITVRAVRDGDQLVMSVSDNGPGIPAHDLPRVFERFYRADKARHRELGGTGLGLSIVKHIAQLHGGSAEAESSPGQGTTVRVRLPMPDTES